MRRSVLFVSNGVGEDLIASRIAALLAGPEISITAYPLVGEGAYSTAFQMLDPRKALPSGGFSMRAGQRGLLADLRAGLVGLWLGQRRTLAAQRGRHDLIVAVGDTYCLSMAALSSPRVAFVSTADSVRIGEFGLLGRRAMRRHASVIFARDPDTAAALRETGLQAWAPGNVMMDMMEPTGEAFGLPEGSPVVALLPGSRLDALSVAPVLAAVAAEVADEIEGVAFLMAVAPSVPLEAVSGAIARADGARGVRIQLTGRFADAVARADVVVGLAGTANEQAAGIGRPVVAFPGPGAQFGPAFLAAQHRLLGEALVAARDWRQGASAVARLLRDPKERADRGAVGRERMGPPGGALRIAGALRRMVTGEGTAAGG